MLQVLILEDTYYFKAGEIVEGEKKDDGVMIENHFVNKDSFINLNEALSPADEEQVRRIIRDLLKRMFWRQYTRSAFMLK